MTVNLSKKTCDTIGCHGVATHILTTPGLDPEEGNAYVDEVCEPCGQGYMRRPALRATLAPMAPPAMPQSGYTPCACRDCMDETVSSDTGKPELCGDCIDADCLRYSEADEREGVPSYSYECQRAGAYDQDA